ncbi:chorismate synthase [Spirochaetota bacterium]
MNSSGRLFRVEIFGESHGPALGVLIDGIPPGTALDFSDFSADIARRRGGQEGTTTRIESDMPEILSGWYRGKASGTPMLILFRNKDTRPSDYEAFRAMPRPGHADFVSGIRYGGFADPRGSGHFSGRITLAIVAAGVVAKRILPGASFDTKIIEAGGSKDIMAAVKKAEAEGDSVGAIVEIRILGLKAGLGEPFFDSVEGLLAKNLFAVPGVRAVEFGDGFAAANMTGSEHNDPYIGPDGKTAKNGAGGINGGISNGAELVVRVAMKPASSIKKAQKTWNTKSSSIEELSVPGRHDPCIALRGAVALEAAIAIALADLELLSRSRSCTE